MILYEWAVFLTQISKWRGTPLYHPPFVGCNRVVQKYMMVHLQLWFQNGVGPPFSNRVVQKLQGGSSPTMISEWGVTPPFATGWFKVEKSFPPNNNNNNNNKPNNNNNWDHSMTCRPSAAGKNSKSFFTCPSSTPLNVRDFMVSWTHMHTATTFKSSIIFQSLESAYKDCTKNVLLMFGTFFCLNLHERLRGICPCICHTNINTSQVRLWLDPRKHNLDLRGICKVTLIAICKKRFSGQQGCTGKSCSKNWYIKKLLSFESNGKLYFKEYM